MRHSTWRSGLILVIGMSCSGAAFHAGSAAEDSPVSPGDEVGPELLIRKSDGLTSRSRFIRSSAQLAGTAQLAPGNPVQFEARPFHRQSCRPVRIVTLWTGEVIPVSWSLPEDSDRMSRAFPANLFGDLKLSAISLKRSSVASIRQPIGCADVCPADPRLRSTSVWQPDKSHTSVVPDYAHGMVKPFWKRRGLQIPRLPDKHPVKEYLVHLSGRWPTSGVAEVRKSSPDDAIRSGGTLTLVFVSRSGQRSLIEVSGRAGKRRIGLPDGRAKVVAVGTSLLQIRLHADPELTLSSHDVVLAKLRPTLGQLAAIEVEGPFVPPLEDQPEGAYSLFLDEPLVRLVDRDAGGSSNVGKQILDNVRHAKDSDRVVLTSGDQVNGVVSEAAQAIRLVVSEGDGRSILIDRKNVAAVCFKQPETSESRPVAGKLAQIDLVPDASCAIGGLEERFWIRSAIRQATVDGLVTHHPLLGDVTVGWKVIQRITPLFEGSYQLIDAGPRHLGNGYRESFIRVEPHGTELALKFQLKKEQMALPTFISADIAELIPSRIGTLKATPFLDEVRNGFLATQVFLNGDLIGMLNDLITIQSPTTEPERVRMLLPARLMKIGKNTIHIRQTSAKHDVASFDDFEIRAMAVEVEHPM
jgi:hypothetical protein